MLRGSSSHQSVPMLASLTSVLLEVTSHSHTPVSTLSKLIGSSSWVLVVILTLVCCLFPIWCEQMLVHVSPGTVSHSSRTMWAELRIQARAHQTTGESTASYMGRFCLVLAQLGGASHWSPLSILYLFSRSSLESCLREN